VFFFFFLKNDYFFIQHNDKTIDAQHTLNKMLYIETFINSLP